MVQELLFDHGFEVHCDDLLVVRVWLEEAEVDRVELGAVLAQVDVRVLEDILSCTLLYLEGEEMFIFDLLVVSGGKSHLDVCAMLVRVDLHDVDREDDSWRRPG